MTNIKKGLAALALAGAATFAFSACGGPATVSDTNIVSAEEPTKKTKTAKPKATEEPKPEPKLSISQEEAIESAESYLDSGDFSKKSLIHQLKYEDFTTKEATYAVNHVEVDWTDEADDSAESYLDSGSFSRKSLLAQLKYEGFTQKQAEHGVNSVF